jgi:hypothetical protein
MVLFWGLMFPGIHLLNAGSDNLPAPQVAITESGNYRTIKANGIPNHPVGQFPNPGNPNSISAQNYNFRVPLHPVPNTSFTPLKMQSIGVAVNGIPFDPGTAEFWNNDRQAGWRVEAIIGTNRTMGLDQNYAHVQPDGAYHYHGVPVGLEQVLGGSQKMTLIGYASDGFPMYGPIAYDKANDPSSVLRQMKPSWQLKKGARPGGNGPGGTYDGTYTRDYEFVSGSGDLDEANGRTGVTPEYPKGTYYYVVTWTFPYYPRELKGTPDPSFEKRPPPGGRMGGGGPPRGFPPMGGGPPPPDGPPPNGGGPPGFFGGAGDRPGPPPGIDR